MENLCGWPLCHRLIVRYVERCLTNKIECLVYVTKSMRTVTNMPAPVKFVCPKCKGQTELANTPCIPCSQHQITKEQGYKHCVKKFVFSRMNGQEK